MAASNQPAAFPEIQGEVIRPADSAYDDARKVWNGMIDKRPAAIIRAANAKDIARTVQYARAQNLPIAIRGGGHNVAGNATCDQGVVLDLGQMKSVKVDSTAKTARAQGGATWADLDRATETFGLATPGGAISTTGIAGLTLGGGYGTLARRYGMVCDNLLSVDIVTAQGEQLTASANENADLFWGLRGGGGNFGVATSFEYRLHPLSGMYSGMLVYPYFLAPEVLRRFREAVESAPDELTLFAGLLPMPDGGRVAGILAFYSGTEENGRKLLEPLRGLGSILMDTIAWIPYTKAQSQLDANYPKGLRNYWKSAFLRTITDDLIDLLVERAVEAPALSHVIFEAWGGAISRVPSDATAFEQREAKYNLLILGLGTDAAGDEEQIAWARDLHRDAQPYSLGTAYTNYLGEGEAIGQAYSANYRRLAELKKKYDPSNVFRLNQNISPELSAP
jgi:FAD/FMN-containing dehydrogenase